MSLAPGSTLGPYTIRAQLGAGGMGVVYRAHDPRLKRQVAIKLLTPDLTRDETAKQRFLQEAQVASALGCIHVPSRAGKREIPAKAANRSRAPRTQEVR